MGTEEATVGMLNIQRKNSLIDNLHIIPSFTGEPNSTTCEEFLEKLNNIAGLFKWDEEEMKFALTNRVSGIASKLIKLHSKKSFQELVKILKDRYVRQDSPDVALSKFLTFKQGQGMLVQDFYDRASDLSFSALVVDGLDDAVAEKSRKAMLFNMLLGNLRPELKKGVITKDPKSAEDVLKFALLEEKALKSINPFLNFQGETNFASASNLSNPAAMACSITQPFRDTEDKHAKEINLLKEKMDLLTAKIDSLVESKSAKNTGRASETPNCDFFCFYCGQANDHYARDCPVKAQNIRSRNNFRGRGSFQNRGNGNGRGSHNRNYFFNQGNFNNRENNWNQGGGFRDVNQQNQGFSGNQVNRGSNHQNNGQRDGAASQQENNSLN